MSSSVRESNLQLGADPEKLLTAMLKCKGWAPLCADLGNCQQGGLCFSQEVDRYIALQAAEVWGSADTRTAVAA